MAAPAYLRAMHVNQQRLRVAAPRCNSSGRAGHRGRGQKSQPLKRGMLHYAHSRNLPIQVGRLQRGNVEYATWKFLVLPGFVML
jgi:hypothetical protein